MTTREECSVTETKTTAHFVGSWAKDEVPDYEAYDGTLFVERDRNRFCYRLGGGGSLYILPLRDVLEFVKRGPDIGDFAPTTLEVDGEINRVTLYRNTPKNRVGIVITDCGNRQRVFVSLSQVLELVS